MHTAEHLLSAVMKKFYHAPRNLEFHLGERKTKCDYQVPRALNEGDIQQIERLVNQEIQRGHAVSSFVLTREQAGQYDLWKVPPEAREIRIVKIGEFDEQPCGGEHVANTSEIGTFRIISYELRANHGRVRIRFRLEN
jgi:Ser-tRNA(Ala) deacylase AlaX